MNYSQIKDKNLIQTSKFVNVIEKALEETKSMENSNLRIEVVNKILFEKIHVIGGIYI
ncbi:MAG: hypothetical protein HFG29_01200 [Eubacterium sp.]|nr:hypothetical protein [Eubacterium sp.]